MNTIDDRIESLITRQDEGLSELRRLAQDEARCQQAFEQAYAVAILKVDTAHVGAGGTVPKMTETRRKAMADQTCADERLAYLLAKNFFMVQRTVLATLSSQAELLRTLSANNRSVFGAP